MRFVFYDDILKRKNAFDMKSNDIVKENCSFLYKRSKNGYNEAVKFMKECSIYPEMCTNYITELSDIMKKYPDDKVIDKIWHNDILPKIYTESYPITSDEKANLQFKKNKVCDRILANHKKIQESYDISDFVRKYGKLPEFTMNKICESVNNFTLPNHGKVIVALEEFYYLMESNGYEYDNATIGKVPIEYFYHNDNPGSVLEESFYKSISIPFEKSWINNNDNDLDYKLFHLREGILSIKDNKEANKFIIENTFNIMKDIPNIVTDSDSLTKVSDKIRNYLSENSKYRYNIYDSRTISERILSADNLIDKKIVNSLNEMSNILYYDYNIKCMSNSILSESDKIITLNEFKLFKFNNLLNAVHKIDKYLAMKINNVKDRTMNRIKEVKKKVFSESVYDAITEDGSVDYTFYTFMVEDCIDKSVHSLFTNICKCINESVIMNTDYTCYYIATENMITLHLRSDDKISITESEMKEMNNYISEDDLNTISEIAAYGELSDIISNYPVTVEKITEFFSNNIDDTETIKAFIELCSYSCINHTEIESAFNNLQLVKEDFADLSMIYKYDMNNYYEKVSLPIEIQLEAYCDITDILYEEVKPIANKKIVNNKITKDNSKNKNISNDKEDVKNKKQDSNTDKQKIDDKNKKPEVKKEDINSDKVGGVNFNSIKLMLAGLKKKAKDFGSKEQEVSRNIDFAFNSFVKACKNALVSDRREAIIKGSVIPSFSKCIKLSIPLAILGKLNPAAAVITTIGGLAMSKRLTNKERALLLDDIEVEIEVLDKEISMAESKNQMKKLRALMRTKKDLQRQYQRIKYGMRVGKDILPSSNYKTPGGDK